MQFGSQPDVNPNPILTGPIGPATAQFPAGFGAACTTDVACDETALTLLVRALVQSSDTHMTCMTRGAHVCVTARPYNPPAMLLQVADECIMPMYLNSSIA